MPKTIYKSISKAFDKVDTTIKLGTKRALNRTATSTRAYIAKELKPETGLKVADIKRRLIANKTAKGNEGKYSFRASVGIAIKALLPLRLFKPKSKKVKTNRGARYAATVKIGKQGRVIVEDGGFMMQLKSGTEIVAQRKGKARTPTKEALTKIFQETVQLQLKSYKTYARDTFKKLVGPAIDHAVKTRLSSSKDEE